MYIPATRAEQADMLASIGLSDWTELFRDIPASVRLTQPLDLPQPLSEMELAAEMRRLAARNSHMDDCCSFLGAGAYDHYVPAAVKNLVARQEFYTAYTPYQPEISQGTLQAIFEYQTMICALTGMDVANASMYDGASALAEAALMAAQLTRRSQILAATSLHPHSRAVVDTYARFGGLIVDSVNYDPISGAVDLAALEAQVTDATAAVLIQNPGFFGIVEDLAPLVAIAHRHGALLVVCADPIALALLRSPGEAGADIVVGDGQMLGNSLNFGGPSLGFFAARQALLRRMPGRIVGETADNRGRRSYVLTIQTREQHIRRDKATSNICTNQALNALTATIYLALMGPQGLRRAATLCAQQSCALHKRLIELPGFQPLFTGPFFREFAVRYSGDLIRLNQDLAGSGLIGGLDVAGLLPDLAGIWLLAVTERRTDADLDRLLDAVKASCQSGEVQI
jgi:glycine dehydrogenase subunit 1